MKKNLYKENVQTLIESDDLHFDGKSLIIPSYWVGSILDYIKNFNTDMISEADAQDFDSFKAFLESVEDFKNKN